MFSFRTSKKLVSILFVLATFGAAAGNIYAQLPSFKLSVQNAAVPDSLDTAKDAVAYWEDIFNTTITGKSELIDAYAYLHLLMGKKEVSDFAQVRSERGTLHYGNPFPLDTAEIEECAMRVFRLSQAAEKKGAKVIFLNPIDLVVKGYTTFEPGMPYQDLNIVQDAFLHHLRQFGVASLDIRYQLPKTDLPPERYAFKTDHHWTVEACFESFKSLVAEMNRKFEAGLDPDGFYRDPDNYNFTTYHGTFLGSLGRSTGVVYSGFDDFTCIWPQFEMEYSLEMIDMLHRFIERSGPAERSIFYPPALDPRNPYKMMSYNFYLMGIAPWVKITNRSNPGGPKLLLVHDSYSTPLACFLAPLFSEVHMIWPLADNPIQVDMYMNDYKFDYVIVELIPANLSKEGVHFFQDISQASR